MDFRIKPENYFYGESIAHSNYANNDLAYYKGTNSTYAGKFFKFRETQYTYGDEICSDNNLITNLSPLDASKIGFTVTDYSWLFDNDRYCNGDYIFTNSIVVLNRWRWYPAINTKWRITFAIRYRDNVHSSSDWNNAARIDSSAVVTLDVTNRYANDSNTPQQTVTTSCGKITCKVGTDGYPALYFYLQAYNGRVPESVRVTSIKKRLYTPNPADGYVDVTGLYGSGYHLISLDNAPNYLKDYDAFKGRLKINGTVQRYARRGFAPMHTRLASVSTPGYYFIEVYNNQLLLEKVDTYPNPSRIESTTVLFDYNSDNAKTCDAPKIINIQAVAGGGGGGGWHKYFNWGDKWNGGGGGGGGGGFSCMCWIPTLKSGGNGWGLSDGSPHVLYIGGGGGAYYDSDDSTGGTGGQVWIKFKASDSHKIVANGGSGGNGSNGGSGGTVSVTGESNDYFWNTQTFTGGAGGGESGGTGGNVSYSVSGYDVKNSTSSGTNSGGYGFPNGGGGGASWMHSADYMTGGGAVLHGDGGYGAGGWGAYCENDTSKSNGLPGYKPIVYFYY